MSKRRDVLLAVKALVTGALANGGFPDVEVYGFDADMFLPANGGVYGSVIGTMGEADDPEVDLSPLAFNYRQPFGIDVLPPETAVDASEAIDRMGAAIGAGVEADRTLGGLADWIEATMMIEDQTDQADAVQRWGQFAIMVEFSTGNPLGT